MTDITIPPEALEAGARAIYFAFTEANIGDGEDRWDRLLPRYRAEYREQARAAFLAVVEMWPDMAHRVMPYPALILPLTETSTTENDNG
jgi:hypothetical protein